MVIEASVREDKGRRCAVVFAFLMSHRFGGLNVIGLTLRATCVMPVTEPFDLLEE
jgi:hypothetical protein